MSGRVLPFIGSREPWQSGRVSEHAHCVLAPNPSAWTLDGTNTWLLVGSGASIVVDPGPDLAEHQRFTIPWLFAASVVMTIAALLFGVLTP